MTRTEAASLIAESIENASSYTTSVWAPEGDAGPVRVYVTIPAANWKKKAQKIGFVAVETDGALTSELSKQSGTIMGMVPEDIQITPAVVAERVAAAPKQYQDEDVAAFNASAGGVGRSESAREQG